MADDRMKEGRKLYISLLFTSTFLGAVGQVLFKMGVVGGTALLLIEYVLLGLIAYAISTLVYFYVLSRVHLSWAYGFSGLSYIFASVIAFTFLGEQVSILRWLGIMVIAMGTLLISVS